MACQRQEDTDFRLPDALEEIADDNLCTYQREYGYGNAYASGSNIYQLFITGKDGRYGMGEQFADKEACTGDTYSGNDGQAQGSLHTVVLLRTEVIAYNRLHSHRQPQYNHYIEYQQSVDNAICPDGHIASVLLEAVVYDNHNDTCRDVHQKR